jgi:signal transduction histidine kinase
VKTDGFSGNLFFLIKSRPRETVLVVAAASILLLLTFFSFWLTERVFADAETADILNRYNAKLTLFMHKLRAIESSQRGYLLAGTPAFAEPYKEMSDQLLPLAQELIAEAPEELAAASQISGVLVPLKAKLQEMAESIAFVDSGQRARGIKQLRNGSGRALADEIENKVSAVQEAGIALIQRNETQERRLQRFKLFVDGVGALLILTFSFLSLWLLLRSNAATQTAQDALEKANRGLEATVAQRTAALARANEEIQRFAYIVSHDLRTPLVNIMGFTSELETLQKELFDRFKTASGQPVPATLGKDFDEALAFIKSSIVRMERLIAAVLRISRDGSRPLNSEAVDMNALTESLFAAMAHQIRDKKATLRAGLLPPIVTDRFALEQIFSNLIENAIKFLKPGEDCRIEVSGRIEGAEAVYTVSDNGRGIDPKDHARIFELFRRSGDQDVPGEGIGLAYVAALARRLGGTIDVESELGQGSAFTVKLPRAMAMPVRRAA